MKFLLDSQLPGFLAVWLRDRGHDARHVRDFTLQNADDNTIWKLALDRGAVVVTKDRDFAEWASTRVPAPPILWLRIGNVANAILLARISTVLDEVVVEFESGARVVEVGRE